MAPASPGAAEDAAAAVATFHCVPCGVTLPLSKQHTHVISRDHKGRAMKRNIAMSDPNAAVEAPPRQPALAANELWCTLCAEPVLILKTHHWDFHRDGPGHQRRLWGPAPDATAKLPSAAPRVTRPKSKLKVG